MVIIPLKDIEIRHELELKWIKLLHTPHPLGFNDNIYHESNISRLPDFDVFFSLLDIRKRNKRSHGKHKNGKLKLFLYLHFVIWILRLINSIIELTDFMMQQFLPSVTLNMHFGYT